MRPWIFGACAILGAIAFSPGLQASPLAGGAGAVQTGSDIVNVQYYYGYGYRRYRRVYAPRRYYVRRAYRHRYYY